MRARVRLPSPAAQPEPPSARHSLLIDGGLCAMAALEAPHPFFQFTIWPRKSEPAHLIPGLAAVRSPC